MLPIPLGQPVWRTLRSKVTVNCGFRPFIRVLLPTLTLFNSAHLFLTAVEIHGHEKPIIVGLTEDIHCSTHLNATKMEWFLVGVDEPLEKSYGRHLTLTIDAKSTGLNGAMFTCQVTDVEGNKYEESVTVTVKGL